MDEIIGRLAAFFGILYFWLFGHAGLWSTIAGIVSFITFFLGYSIVLWITIIAVRSPHIGPKATRFCRIILALEVIVIAWVFTAIIGVILESKGIDFKYSIPPTLAISYLILIIAVTKIKKRQKKRAEVQATNN